MIDYSPSDHTANKNRETLRKLAKRANERLRQFEKHGMTEAHVYQRATLYRHRFQAGCKSMTDKAIAAELRRVVEFLNYKTSTVAGYRRYVNEAKQALRKHGVSEDTLSSREFYDILSSSSFRKLHGVSEEIVQFIDIAHDEGSSWVDIQEAIDDYRKGKTKTLRALYKSQGLDITNYE